MVDKYVLSLAAHQDIDEIIAYLAVENINAAYTFLDALYAALDTLAEHPGMGHSRQDLTDKPVKFWTFKWHYLIIYREAKPLEIARVLSGYRDLVQLI